MNRGYLGLSTMLRRRAVPAPNATSSAASPSHVYSTTTDSASSNSDHEAPSDSQTLRLSSGRVLGYATYGAETGYPLFFFHGFPSSRLEASVLSDGAKKRNMRIISMDRPGFGISSFQPGRRFVDWPADVAAVAQHLDVKRFAVLGASGGGPYALACAHLLPKEQVSAVGLFASAGPWAAGTQDLPRESRVLGWLVRRVPGVMESLMSGVVGFARWMLTTRYVTRWLDGIITKEVEAAEKPVATTPGSATDTDDVKEPLLSKTTEPDQQADNASVEERRHRLIRMLLEAFAHGTAGTVQEAELLSSTEWGFRFEDVDYDKVQIWHGTKDSRSPIGQIRYMAQLLPHAELIEFDEQGHFDMAKEFEDALDSLVPAAEREAAK